MRISESFHYPAPIDEVWEMMTDEEFHERVCVATFATSHSVQVTRHDDQTATVVTTRQLPTDGFPDFAKPLVGQSLTATQTIVYRRPDSAGARVGELKISMGTAPIGLTGKIVIRPAGDDSTHVEVTGSLVCAIPFLGSKIEQVASGPALAGIRKEHGVGMAWLADE